MASANLDRYNRVIRNLYTAVFERAEKRSNTIFKQTFQLPTASAIMHDRSGYFTEVMRDFPTYYVTFDEAIVHDSNNVQNRQVHYDWAKLSNYWKSATAINPPLNEAGGLLYGYTGNKAKVRGVSQSIQTISTQSAVMVDFTMECIIEFSANPTAGASIDLMDMGGMKLTINDQRKLVLTNSLDTTRTATTALVAGTRYHIMWVRNRGVSLSTLYVNGVAVDTWAVTSNSQNSLAANPKILTTNATAWGGTFYLDEVAFYRHVLPAHRNARHYKQYIDGSRDYPEGIVQVAVAPVVSWYEDLTNTGANTSEDDSAYLVTTGMTLSYTPYSTVVNAGVVRIRPGWAFNAAPTSPTIWKAVQTAGTDFIELLYDSAANNWVLRRKAPSGTQTDLTIAGNHGRNQDVTIAWWSNSTTLFMSLDGAAFVSVGNTAASGLTADKAATIGYGTNPSDCYFHWFIGGMLMDSTRMQRLSELMHANGNFDPDWHDIPYSDILLPRFLWWGRTAAHQPTDPLNGSFV